MKLTLKHLLLVVALLFGAVSIKAGEPIRWGVVGGMNLSRIKADTDYRFGYHTGMKVELPLPKNLYLESGLMYTRKGFSYEHTNVEPIKGYGSEYYTRETMYSNKHMLELPIHIGYKLAINDQIKLFASGGVYFGYGLWGKMKGKEIITSYEDHGYGEDHTENFLNSTINAFDVDVYDVEKRFDWGLGLKAGVEAFNHLQLSVSYDWGINKLYSGTSKGNNRNLMVSVAYMFN